MYPGVPGGFFPIEEINDKHRELVQKHTPEIN